MGLGKRLSVHQMQKKLILLPHMPSHFPEDQPAWRSRFPAFLARR
jgi:hypothetical protein